MTAAHEQVVRINFIERWPEHEPRENDPHYKFFHAAKARMKRQGLLNCNVRSAHHYGAIELHHAACEFAHVNDIDIDRFNALWGLHLDDEQFREFVMGAQFTNDKGELVNGLEPLCTEHHRGVSGIHSLPSPEWNVLRAAKEDRAILIVQSNSGIGVDPAPQDA